MSSLRALCCLPSVKKHKHDLIFFPVQCIIKQLLYSVFVISRIIKVSVWVIRPQPSASADNSYLDFDYSGYHKNFIQ